MHAGMALLVSDLQNKKWKETTVCIAVITCWISRDIKTCFLEVMKCITRDLKISGIKKSCSHGCPQIQSTWRNVVNFIRSKGRQLIGHCWTDWAVCVWKPLWAAVCRGSGVLMSLQCTWTYSPMFLFNLVANTNLVSGVQVNSQWNVTSALPVQLPHYSTRTDLNRIRTVDYGLTVWVQHSSWSSGYVWFPGLWAVVLLR